MDVPVATGSAVGLSPSPVSATVKAVPPLVAVRSVFGQPPLGAGEMSAAASAFEVRSFTYGLVFDAVR